AQHVRSPGLSVFFAILRRAPTSALFPYTTLFRSRSGRNLSSFDGRNRSAPRSPSRNRSVHRPALLSPRRYYYAHLHRRLALLRRSEEHTSELQSRFDLVCRLLLEKKNKIANRLDS